MASENIKNIKIEDFNYPLPDERIALHPLAQRDACKLLVSLPGGEIVHSGFSRLPEFISPDALLICNETRVINARMEFFKSSGGRIEIFILEPFSPADYVLSFASKSRCIWTCMIGNLKKWKDADLTKVLNIEGCAEPVTLTACLLPLEEGKSPSASRRVEFSWDNPDVTFASIVEAAGNIPIPPYLKRASEASDLEDYQTVYSRVEGSVAAPTAGLHFTPELFAELRSRGVEIEKVTLHVGAGTFQPVKSERIGDHHMHTETIHVDLSTIKSIIAAMEAGREIIAVGTTSVRTIESLPYFGYLCRSNSPADVDAMHLSQWLAYDEDVASNPTLDLLRELADALEKAGLDALTASTAIMIAPGFGWRIVMGMVTNFHQPQSTLLLLVSSFLESGMEEPPAEPKRWRILYEEALQRDYRFLSYGDACLFFPVGRQLNRQFNRQPHPNPPRMGREQDCQQTL